MKFFVLGFKYLKESVKPKSDIKDFSFFEPSREELDSE